MKRFKVTLSREFEVEAETEQEAKTIAYERLDESYNKSLIKNFLTSFGREAVLIPTNNDQCPHCYSYMLQISPISVINEREVMQNVSCDGCFMNWQTFYKYEGRYETDGARIDPINK